MRREGARESEVEMGGERGDCVRLWTVCTKERT